MPILLHPRPAAGRVDDDGIHAGTEEGVDVPSGHGLGRHRLAVVHVQRGAAALILWDEDVAAVAAEHTHSRLIDLAEEKRTDPGAAERPAGALAGTGAGPPQRGGRGRCLPGVFRAISTATGLRPDRGSRSASVN